MVKEALVKEMILAGNQLLDMLNKEKFRSPAAFWYFSENKNKWELVITSPYSNTESDSDIYLRITRILNGNSTILNNLDLSDIRIVSSKDPVIANLKNKFKQLSFPIDGRIFVPGFSGDFIEDVYIYQL